MPRTWIGLIALVVTMAFLGGAVVYVATERSDSPPGQSSVDVGFLQDMMTHHDQALVLATTQLGKGGSAGVSIFAEGILQQQAYELGSMNRHLGTWGYTRQQPETAMEWMGTPTPAHEMPGMASDDELQALQEAEGEDANALFIALMSDHHRGGVHMATAAAEAAKDSWVGEFAARVARIQAGEIEEMQAARRRLGLTATPPGHSPGPLVEGDGHGSHADDADD